MKTHQRSNRISFQMFEICMIKFICNPFEIQKLTIINTTTVSFCKELIADIKNIEREGELQFNRYLNERLIMGKISINAKNTQK